MSTHNNNTVNNNTVNSDLKQRLLELGTRIRNGEQFLTSEAQSLANEIDQLTPPFTSQPFSSSVVSLAFDPLTNSVPQTQEDIQNLAQEFNKHLLGAAKDIDGLNAQDAQTFITEVRDYFFGTAEFQWAYANLNQNKDESTHFDFVQAIATEMYHFAPKTFDLNTITDMFSYMRDIHDTPEQPSVSEQVRPQQLAVKAIIEKRNTIPYEPRDFTSTVLPINFHAGMQRPNSEEQVQSILEAFGNSFAAVTQQYQALSDTDKRTFIKEMHDYFKSENSVLSEYNPTSLDPERALLQTVLETSYKDVSNPENYANQRKLAIEAWVEASWPYDSLLKSPRKKKVN